jgi:hypothetical protein
MWESQWALGRVRCAWIGVMVPRKFAFLNFIFLLFPVLSAGRTGIWLEGGLGGRVLTSVWGMDSLIVQ